MAKRQSVARKSKAGGGPRKSAAGGARKSAAGQRKSLAKRKSSAGNNCDILQVPGIGSMSNIFQAQTMNYSWEFTMDMFEIEEFRKSCGHW